MMNKKNEKNKLNLFITYFKIGLFTFGGGYAMIALLENEFVSKKKWITKDEFLNIIAISESTPGPIAINCATYIGYHVAGFSGAVVATTAVCIPSFVIIYIISLFLDKFLSLTYVAYAFKGIQACVVYMILSAGLKMLKGINKKPLDIAILVTVTVVMIAFSVFSINFSSVFYILICGVIGIAAYLLNKICGKGKAKK